MALKRIELRGVEVHNLKQVDLDLPHRRLTVLCGVSGSGKTSLAFDTLYAEGQRRYIETFSAYTRQFLEQLEKPAAERIDGLPPAIAVNRKDTTKSSRSTVATATELADYFRLLFAKIGRVHCVDCGCEVRRASPRGILAELQAASAGRRALVGFLHPLSPDDDPALLVRQWREDGLIRVVADGRLLNLAQDDQLLAAESAVRALCQNAPPLAVAPAGEPADPLDSSETPDEPAPRDARDFDADDAPASPESSSEGDDSHDDGEGAGDDSRETLDRTSRSGRAGLDGPAAPAPAPPAVSIPIVVDRLVIGDGAESRWLESLETALAKGGGRCVVLAAADEASGPAERRTRRSIDGAAWDEIAFASALSCPRCARQYAAPLPQSLSFNSPLGACPRCEGFGNIVDVDLDRVVPDKSKSLADGAIAPWNTPAYQHELQELLGLAADYGLRVDVPYRELTEAERAIVLHGAPERRFGGLDGFFAWLEKRKYKMHLRVYLNRWRSSRVCPACEGRRLRPEALAVRLGGVNLAEACGMTVARLRRLLAELPLSESDRAVCATVLPQIEARLRYLDDVGLGYLALDRPLRTLSGGEAQRVALTSALGSSLVNMLYVLDEPSVGLHPADVRRLLGTIEGLRDRGNTVVVVEHEEAFFEAADHLVEIGPAAGDRGGEVVFQGGLAEMKRAPQSLTGDYLAGRRVVSMPSRRRSPNHGWIRLTGARGHNLQNLTVEFPLGVLCVVTGVSGAGKSSLVQDTLFGAICQRKRRETDKPLPFDDVFGDGQIDDVQLVDQSPIGRSPRSNPVTYIKAFDQIRAVFAETLEAKTHNYDAGHFSFNVAGGRCETCEGDGFLEIDMQFLPDVFVKCGQCGGRRYRQEILAVTYRGRNIADVLDMTVREAFGFFRGQSKVQAKLKQLIDVGLDYLRLGQPANTLSAGEAQRLKLAAYLSAAGRHRTLFILDEPTTGLHYADIVQLLDCFDALLNVGHSLIVVEHNVHVMKAADYLIDLGPGAGDQGGRVVASGTPEKVARVAESATARWLAEALEAARPDDEDDEESDEEGGGDESDGDAEEGADADAQVDQEDSPATDEETEA